MNQIGLATQNFRFVCGSDALRNTPNRVTNKEPGRRQGVVIGGQGAKLEPVVEAFVFELGKWHLKKRRAFQLKDCEGKLRPLGLNKLLAKTPHIR